MGNTEGGGADESRPILRLERFGGLLYERDNVEISLVSLTSCAQLARTAGFRVVSNHVGNPNASEFLLVAPTKVSLVLTNHCNLSCAGCLNESSPRRSRFLSFDLLRSCIDQSYRMGVFEVGFTGGEPFLHPRFIDCTKLVRSYGMGAHVNTNGVVDRDSVEALIAARPDLVRVSIDGLQRVNDALRGPGTFEKAVASLRRLRGSLPRVGINFTASRRNVAEIPGMVDLAESIGCELKISPLVAMGRAVARTDDVLSIGERRAERDGLCTRLARRACSSSVRMVTEFFSNECSNRDANVPFPRSECGVGWMHLGIDFDGQAYATGSQTDFRPENAIGHCLDVPLAEIWRRGQNMRAQQAQQCGPCDPLALLLRGLTQPIITACGSRPQGRATPGSSG
jgi:MoaA/NifB/PqqE/SkfB family radical SAM enzyme